MLHAKQIDFELLGPVLLRIDSIEFGACALNNYGSCALNNYGACALNYYVGCALNNYARGSYVEVYWV